MYLDRIYVVRDNDQLSFLLFHEGSHGIGSTA